MTRAEIAVRVALASVMIAALIIVAALIPINWPIAAAVSLAATLTAERGVYRYFRRKSMVVQR